MKSGRENQEMATETRDRDPVGNGARPPGAQVPKLSDGIELIGEYEGSGFKESPYIARRGDGQVIQLSHLLHSVAEHSDGQRDFGQVAERVSEDVGRKVSRDNVRFLVEKKLRPIGVLAAADGSSPKLKRADRCWRSSSAPR
jgi:putative peptide zinc metalloprotease protein